MNILQENERVLLLAQHLEELKTFYRVNYEFKSFGALKIDNEEDKTIELLNKKYLKYKNKYKHIKYNKYIEACSDTSDT